jgi:predicted enzyme related to lactoylglutathione lyase
MTTDIRYVHTNIVAKDWKALAQFYCDVFGCKIVGPLRDLSGKWIDTLTEIKLEK